jgi:outer membrane protein TolC
MQWRNFFTNKNLQNLIDTALQNNQELQITLQEIEIAKNDARVLLPTVGLRAGWCRKVGYTSQGAGDASTKTWKIS